MKITPTNDSASIGATEYYLFSDSTTKVDQTGYCKLFPTLDFANLVAGDQFRVRVYEKVNGGTQGVLYEDYFTGVQSQLVQLGPFMLGEAYEVSVKMIQGSSRTIGWSLRKEEEGETVALSTASRDAVVDATWDEALSGHSTAGTAGKALSDVAAASPPSAAVIADAVCDEALAGHASAGSVGKAISDILAFGAPPAATAVRDAILDRATSSHVTAGTVGKAIGDSATASALAAVAAAVAALPSSAANASATVTALRAYAVRTGITFDDLMAILVAYLLGKATNLNGSAPVYFDTDETTPMISTTQDTVAGTREKSTYPVP